MSDQYYLRVRGSVVGPFREDQVRQLVQRGKLGRFHEISVDRSTWRRLESFPHLLPHADALPTSSSDTPAQPPASGDSASAAQQRSTLQTARPVPARAWCYAQQDGTQCGPEDESVLAALISSGQLSPTTLVWTAGMQRWVAVEESPLAVYLPQQSPGSYAAGNSPQTSPDTHAGELPQELVAAATASIPWARTVSILWAVGWSCAVILNMVLVFLVPSVVGRTVQFLSAVYGAFAIWSCVICFQYTSALSALRYTNSAGDLLSALKRLNQFWIWTTILIVVFTGIATFSAILAAAGVADAVNAGFGLP